MAKIYAGAANWVDFNTTKTIHNGPGKIRGIIISAIANGNIFFYDGDASSTKLLLLNPALYTPQLLLFDILMPIVFTNKLTIVTDPNVSCFVFIEA